MSLPASWVESLFARLSVRYGIAFARQYEGFDMAAIKADWADVLAGFDGDSIAYALRYLPTERPPNALQFRDICRRAPSAPVVALPAPPADPQRVAAALERMKKPEPKEGSAAAVCAAGLRRKLADGAKLTQAQHAMLESCEKHMTGEPSADREELEAAKERAAQLVAQHLGSAA